jgi:ribosome biogenesis protein YTM1
MEEPVKPGGAEAVIIFTTKLPEEYQVPEDQLVVPAALARYGLSEVVNRLLSLERPLPFDFLADGEFLRTTVAQHMEAHKLSSEKVLKLEYVFALSEPEQKEVDQVPDWISAVAPLQALPSAVFAATSYDGTARVYSDGSSQLTVRLSDTPITGLAALPTTQGSHLVAAGKDGCIRSPPASTSGLPCAFPSHC